MKATGSARKAANMPAGWQPPAPAWEARWDDTNDALMTVVFGTQGDTSGPLGDWAAQVFSALAPFFPIAVERAQYQDATGNTHHVFVSYWRQSVYEQWRQHDAVQSWWASDARLNEQAVWRESFAMLDKRFETLHSTPNAHGVSVSAQVLDGPLLEHGYSGGMRDRIAQSEHESLAANEQVQCANDGVRARIVLPQNSCVIRSGQNWGECNSEQRDFYLHKVHPVLQEGMRYLRDEGHESGCLLMRFANCYDAQWQALPQSFGLGYARDITVFEDWARSHPTHIAIFDTFMQMVEQFGESLSLQLWHEVTVLGPGGADCEYINCPAIVSALSGRPE